MRKVCNFMIAMVAVVVLLVGCGTVSPGNNKNNNAQNVELNGSYTASDGLVFTLFKVKTTDKLESIAADNFYWTSEKGFTYADVVISLTNTGSEEFSAIDDINAFFESTDGTKYEDVLVAVEADHLDQFATIKPLATNKIHIGYQIPTDITKGKAYFDFDGDLFVVDYDADVEVSNKTAIVVNQEITADDAATFKLLRTVFTNDVLPPDTSGFYEHYPVADPSNNTFFVAYCDITNVSTAAIEANKMISAKAIFDGKYEYTSKIFLEAKDGTGFDLSYTSVTPLETRRALFVFEVPKKVQDMNPELVLYFYGDEYSCSGLYSAESPSEEVMELSEEENIYNRAKDAEERGFYTTAMELYSRIDGYSDSKQKAEEMLGILRQYNGTYYGSSTQFQNVKVYYYIEDGIVRCQFEGQEISKSEYKLYKYGTSSDGSAMMAFGSDPVRYKVGDTYTYGVAMNRLKDGSYVVAAVSGSDNTSWNATSVKKID